MPAITDPNPEVLLKEYLMEIANDPAFGNRVVKSTLVDQTAGEAKQTAQAAVQTINDADIVPNDGVPPTTPTGVQVNPISRGIEVFYDLPQRADRVEEVEVTLSSASGTQVKRYEELGAVVIRELLVQQYTVTIRFVDAWGLRSGASAQVTVTPLRSVADEITEETIVAGGDFAQLLNNPALAAFDSPDKLVDGVLGTLSGASAGTYPADRILNPRLLAAWDVVAARAIISNGIIERAMIANASISTAKIDDLAVVEAKIANASITTVKIANASITTAKVDELSVSRLTAGNISAANMNLVGSGAFNAVRGDGLIYTKFSIDGIQLRDTGSFYEDPRVNVGSKITPIKGLTYGAWGFTQTSGVQGSYLVAVGDGTHVGRMAIEAFPNYASIGTDNSARILMDGGRGSPQFNLLELSANQVVLKSLNGGFQTTLEGGLKVATGITDINGTMDIQSTLTLRGSTNLADSGTRGFHRYFDQTIGGSASYVYNHGLPGIPYDVQVWELIGGGNWRKVVDGTRGWEVYTGTDSVIVSNTQASGRRVRVYTTRL